MNPCAIHSNLIARSLLGNPTQERKMVRNPQALPKQGIRAALASRPTIRVVFAPVDSRDLWPTDLPPKKLSSFLSTMSTHHSHFNNDFQLRGLPEIPLGFKINTH